MGAWIVRLLGVAGILVSAYALHVELQLKRNPFYEPACNTSWGSCGTVFSSSYAHLLSHWGVVPKGHPLDISLATAGMLNYAVYVVYPASFVGRIPYHTTLLLLVSVAGILFSCYLLYVLKVVLKDFCIVCVAFHTINFSMFFFGTLPEYRNPTIHVPDSSRKKQE
eukprot:Sspe_Gene.16532::Locus_5831_Transcript_1_1_Confidence_1.000_Length_563::g.16532::m.16532/K05357/VKORC1; vitamin-K-epoxide reductase (warfarin-sensitive)